MASESKPFLSPQEIEALKRYVLLVLAAAVGALAGFFIPPTSGELNWTNVWKAIVGAVLAALIKAWGSGRMDAARASVVDTLLREGLHPAQIDDLRDSDVGAVAIRQMWPLEERIDQQGASETTPPRKPNRVPTPHR